MSERMQKTAPLPGAARDQFFVKVVRQQAPPGRWTWEVYRDGGQHPLWTSEDTFRSAQEAWEAGRATLSA